MKLKVLLIVITMGTMLCLVGCNKDKDDLSGADVNNYETDINTINIPDVVATVNDILISGDDYIKAYSQMKLSYEKEGLDFASLEGVAFLDTLKTSAIQQLLQEEILRQVTEQDVLSITDKEALDKIESYKSQFSTVESYEAALIEMQLTEEELLPIYKSQIAINNYLLSHIEEVVISDNEVKKRYDEYVLYLVKTSATEIPDYEVVKDTFKEEVIKNIQNKKMLEFINQLIESSDVKVYF